MTPAYGPTLDFHQRLAEDLPIEDGQDLINAQRGFLGTTEPAAVLGRYGHVVWSQRGYGLLDDEKPADAGNRSHV